MNKNDCFKLTKEYHIAVNSYILERFRHWTLNYSDVAKVFGVHNSLITAMSIGDRLLSLENIFQYCIFFHETPMEALKNIKFYPGRFLTLKAIKSKEYDNLPEHSYRSKRADEEFKDRKAKLLSQYENESSEYKRICIKLNIALQELRIEGGVSQKMLAAILGVSENGIRKFEKGAVGLTYRHIVAYALVIGLDPLSVFARADVDWQHFVNKKIPFDVNMFVENKKNTVKTDWRKGLAKIEIE